MNSLDVHARLTYLSPRVESSLYRNGKVFTRRDRDGNDDGYHGASTEERELLIKDGRVPAPQRRHDLWAHGFQLVEQSLEGGRIDFFDHRQVLQAYYPQCAALVREAVDAREVFAFDHNLRWAPANAAGRRIAGGQQIQAPIHCVHGDYTLASAPQRLRDLARPPGDNDTLRSVLPAGASLLSPERVSRVLEEGRRFALINVWRNIDPTPVMRDPLALCNGQSVATEDLVVFEIHYSDRIGENYFAKYSPRHEWWYFPRLTRDEAVLIKQWDAAGELARSGAAPPDANAGDGQGARTFSFHTAFDDPSSPADAPDRQSIEVRCVALFD